MTAIPSLSIASSTSSNWLAEAQSAEQAAEGGLLGALQSSSQGADDGSIKSFLATSQSNADAFASIAQSSAQAAGQFYAQLAASQGQQAAADRQAEEDALMNPPAQTNYTPSPGLDPVLYYDDGSSLDTTSNILTMAGKQFDTTTGLPNHDPNTIIRMANGAYLETKNNILTMSDGSQMDTITGLKITV